MNYKPSAKTILISFLIFSFLAPILVSAASFDYRLLESIPGFASAGDISPGFNVYIANIYRFAIWVVGICALLMISIGAFMYITSAGNNAAMGKAKGVITDAIIGLILALVAYLLLYTINPELVRPKGIAGGSSSEPISAPGGPTGGTTGRLNNIPTQVANQNNDASPTLLTALDCMWSKKPDSSSFTISSISDNNCGATGYSGTRSSWTQCTSEGQSNCCYHSKTSCHYGGTSAACQGKSYAADISLSQSSLSASQMTQLAQQCGGTVINEGNHIHFSVGNCGCS